MKPFPKEKVKLSTKTNDIKTEKTLELLTLIYNSSSESTEIQNLQSENLRKRLLEEISKFRDELKDYDDNTLAEEYKERVKARIQGHLSNKSPFAAFKRWIIRENEHFKPIFEKFC